MNPAQPARRYGASPVLDDGQVYLNRDGGEDSSLICLDAVTGKERWTAEAKAKRRARNHESEVPDEAVGHTLGRYKLLERVGEGGCGAVYVAEQTEPVRRRVALKVIKLGIDTKQVAKHGSQPKYTLPEIQDDMPRVVRFIRDHASHFGIDPNRIGSI